MRATRVVSEAATNLRRNLLVTFVSILTITISLSLFGGVFMLTMIVNKITTQFRAELEITVFLRDDITEEQFTDLRDRIVEMPEVDPAKFRYVSKIEAYQEFQEMFADSPALVNNVDPAVLPASFRIGLRDPDAIVAVGTRLQGRPGVEEVQYRQEEVERLLSTMRLLRYFMVGVLVVLLVGAVLLISNTIQLAIYARREEIGIMKLVGATNWFVRIPFMLEGFVQGIVGAIAAVGVLSAVRLWVLRPLQELVQFVPLSVDGSEFLKIGTSLVAMGALLGVVGSVIALWRYLEV